MVDVLKKQLDCSYEKGVERVRDAVSEDFSILMEKSISDVVKRSLGLDEYPLKYTTILACGADLACSALDVSVDVGTLMPCSFVVYEKDGEVYAGHVSIMKIAGETGMADREEMKPVIEKTGKRVKKVWERI
ncbi:DUF302 domain-containing protein [Candidatus Bipolaricaulota bacterium]|nr:DUF302 domain-containing protein [Candidatus Bipolaricaulota bacterium]